MNNAKRRVDELIHQFSWFFQVNQFDKILIYCEKDEDNRAAEITLDEPYQRITIRIYPVFFTETLSEQRKALLHEFCHIITLPEKTALHALLDGKLVTPDRIKDLNETATSRIENLLDRLLQNKSKYVATAYAEYLKKKKHESKRKNRRHTKQKSTH